MNENSTVESLVSTPVSFGAILSQENLGQWSCTASHALTVYCALSFPLSGVLLNIWQLVSVKGAVREGQEGHDSGGDSNSEPCELSPWGSSDDTNTHTHTREHKAGPL